MREFLNVLGETFKGLGERNVIQLLALNLFQRSFVVPRFTPPGWFECDLFERTAAGYFREYEIKTGKNDFYSDAKKWRRGGWKFNPFSGEVQKTPPLNKHRALEAGDRRGPSRFFYVLPVDLVPKKDVPEWAGIIFVRVERSRDSSQIFLKAEIERPAPQLHDAKIDAAVEMRAKENLYFRYIRELIGR